MVICVFRGLTLVFQATGLRSSQKSSAKMEIGAPTSMDHVSHLSIGDKGEFNVSSKFLSSQTEQK